MFIDTSTITVYLKDTNKKVNYVNQGWVNPDYTPFMVQII